MVSEWPKALKQEFQFITDEIIIQNQTEFVKIVLNILHRNSLCFSPGISELSLPLTGPLIPEFLGEVAALVASIKQNLLDKDAAETEKKRKRKGGSSAGSKRHGSDANPNVPGSVPRRGRKRLGKSIDEEAEEARRNHQVAVLKHPDDDVTWAIEIPSPISTKKRFKSEDYPHNLVLEAREKLAASRIASASLKSTASNVSSIEPRLAELTKKEKVTLSEKSDLGVAKVVLAKTEGSSLPPFPHAKEGRSVENTATELEPHQIAETEVASSDIDLADAESIELDRPLMSFDGKDEYRLCMSSPIIDEYANDALDKHGEVARAAAVDSSAEKNGDGHSPPFHKDVVNDSKEEMEQSIDIPQNPLHLEPLQKDGFAEVQVFSPSQQSPGINEKNAVSVRPLASVVLADLKRALQLQDSIWSKIDEIRDLDASFSPTSVESHATLLYDKTQAMREFTEHLEETSIIEHVESLLGILLSTVTALHQDKQNGIDFHKESLLIRSQLLPLLSLDDAPCSPVSPVDTVPVNDGISSFSKIGKLMEDRMKKRDLVMSSLYPEFALLS